MGEQAGNYKESKYRGMRKAIGEKMAYSSRENATITQTRKADVTEFLQMRKKKKAEYSDQGISVPSVNDLALKAIALALRDHPNLNSTFENELIRTYEDINISMAVALENGLITPVIRNVDKLSVWEISKLTKEAAEKAKSGKLGIEDVTGGTFTITNVGMVKIEGTTAIINSPQVGIMAIGTTEKQVQIDDGELVERSKMYLSLTVDHRIIDGYPAALFLNSVCDILENSAVLWE
jgi:pyruvate dehydrogenase E2 component (dihydrolipoamide acetyltransferase)